LAKKNQPFNPFDPNSTKKKTIPRAVRDQQSTPAPRTGPPQPLATPEPTPVEEEPSRPAIPLAHLPSDVDDSPVKEEPLEETTDSPSKSEPTADEVEIEPVAESEVVDPEPTVEEAEEPEQVAEGEEPEQISEGVELEDGEEGPATASGLGRGVGLKRAEEEVSEELVATTEERVSGLIAESKQLAADAGMAVPRAVPEVPAVENIPDGQKFRPAAPPKEKGRPRPRRRKIKPPPAKRVTKLNRRKYMEFKVDLREILEEEDVPDEHRANVLGTTWARGERSGIGAALEYVQEKEDEGILSEPAANRIRRVLKSYRTER
jgi:hypothetical protein